MNEDSVKTHTWDSYLGHTKGFNFYICVECGIHMAEPARGSFGFKVWSDNPFNSKNHPIINLEIIPSCSMYKSMKMEEALK